MWSKVGSALCILALAAGCSGEGSRGSIVRADVLAAFSTAPQVDVIVSFDDPFASWSGDELENHRLAIARSREALLAATGGGLVPTRVFSHIAAIAGRLTRPALDILSRYPGVSLIQLNSAGHGSLTVSVPAIGADVAKRDYHVTGKGVRVAVLDTGIHSAHPDLKSSVASVQHCFTHGDCQPRNASEGTSAEDDHGHGSHVAGIITSDGTVAGVGFAPDAEIVAVKINDRSNAGFASDWAAGLDWIFTNLSTLNVQVVNASVSTNQLYGSASDCDRGEPALANAVKNLIGAGVTIFASVGNEGSSTRVSAPACNTGVIAVGATYKSNQGRQPTNDTYAGQWGSTFADCADSSTAFDEVTCFTNSGPRLDIVAPGAVIVSDGLKSQTEAYRGTSQASPTAAGVAALMLECNPKLTPANVKDILVRTGVPVTDAKNNATFPSVRATAAVKEACGPSSPPGLDASATARDAPAIDARVIQDLAGDRLGPDGATDTGGNAGSGGHAGATGAAGGSPGNGGSGAGDAPGGSGGNSLVDTGTGAAGSGGKNTPGGGGAVPSGTTAAGARSGTTGGSTTLTGAGGTGASRASVGGGAGAVRNSPSAASSCGCRIGDAPPDRPPALVTTFALLGLGLALKGRKA